MDQVVWKQKSIFKKIYKLQYSISQGDNTNRDKYQGFSSYRSLSQDRSFSLAKYLYNKTLKINIYNISKEREYFPDMSFFPLKVPEEGENDITCSFLFNQT